MSHDRNMKWLNKHRLIYRRLPATDVPTIETKQYMFFEDGTKFDGEWKKNKQHGRGFFTDKNGQLKEGVWRQGKCEVWGVL